jgi:hypothetical protein
MRTVVKHFFHEFIVKKYVFHIILHLFARAVPCETGGTHFAEELPSPHHHYRNPP